jgi:predicted ATPase
MQKLIVWNFGPIKELDLDIKDLSLFIGEQATGKSTVAKLIYFFKSLRGELNSLLYEGFSVQKGIHKSFLDKAALKFLNLSFQVPNFPSFHIVYKYKDDLFLKLEHSSTRMVRLSFYDSEDFDRDELAYQRLYEIYDKIKFFRSEYVDGETALRSTSEYREIESEKKQKARQIEEQINSFFGEEIEMFFIPASRSLLAILSEQSSGINFDEIIKFFIKNINRLKPAFHVSYRETIAKRKLHGNHIASDKTLELMLHKMKEILKGEYRINNLGDERIYFDDEHFIELSIASSGQQEVVWILLQLFALILNQEKVFLVIEEPEAHLYPKAQKSLVELIALLFNEKNSQVLITTHSPYILTVFNNLIYAGNIGKKYKEATDVIPEEFWLKPENVGAYKLKDGLAEDLMDEETHLIRVEEIDSVSESINQDFEALLNIELQ